MAGLVLGTYTSPLWAGLTIVGATAAGITGAYNAAYGATETPPPPDLQQAMNVVDAVGTVTSIADLGNGVIELAHKPAADIEVIETLSILTNFQGLAEPVTTGVRTALFTQTRGGYTVIAKADHFVIYISPPQADLNFMSYVDSPIQADYQGFYTDARGRASHVLRPLSHGQTARITIWGFTADFEAPQTFSFTF